MTNDWYIVDLRTRIFVSHFSTGRHDYWTGRFDYERSVEVTLSKVEKTLKVIKDPERTS